MCDVAHTHGDGFQVGDLRRGIQIFLQGHLYGQVHIGFYESGKAFERPSTAWQKSFVSPLALPVLLANISLMASIPLASRKGYPGALCPVAEYSLRVAKKPVILLGIVQIFHHLGAYARWRAAACCLQRFRPGQ